jgi:hypothetical protein
MGRTIRYFRDVKFWANSNTLINENSDCALLKYRYISIILKQGGASGLDMPIPGFTEYGILPEGVHDCTIPEAEHFCCSNNRRIEIWAGLQNFIKWASKFPRPDCILIDGSFVTDKLLPSDVDIVVDITNCDTVDQKKWMDAWAANADNIKAEDGVDFYPFVIGNGNDFSVFFQYVRVDEALRRGIPPTVRKGILRVQL